MTRLCATLAATLLLACMTSAVVGLSATCSSGCDDPFGDCAGLCFDCACCPNGVSTFGEKAPAVGGLVSLRPAFDSVVKSPLDAPPAEILHIPKPTLS